MKIPPPPQLNFPPWLKSSHPGLRAFVAVFSVVFVAVQFFSNLPDSALRQKTLPLRHAFDTVGLYHRGWGMFAATNTNTSVVRTELLYADGTLQHIQYIHLRPGFKLSVWNEVMQDMQFDDNNDRAGMYLSGFLRYTCTQYDKQANNPLVSVSFQQQSARFPINKKLVEETQPFSTLKMRQCHGTPETL
jgi:hypothetical protein